LTTALNVLNIRPKDLYLN